MQDRKRKKERERECKTGRKTRMQDTEREKERAECRTDRQMDKVSRAKQRAALHNTSLCSTDKRAVGWFVVEERVNKWDCLVPAPQQEQNSTAHRLQPAHELGPCEWADPREGQLGVGGAGGGASVRTRLV